MPLNKVSASMVETSGGNSVDEQLAEIEKKTDWVSVTDFGVVGDKTTDNTLKLQEAIDYCETNGFGLFIPMAKKEVYRIEGVVDFKKVPLIGSKPLNVFPDSYTQTTDSTNSCIFLDSSTAQLKNLDVASNIGISSNRSVNDLSTVIFEYKATIFWYNVCIAHSGLHGIELPYSAIPLFFDYVDITRTKGDGVHIEGTLITGNPDADTNRVHFRNSHISYSNGHGVYYNATGAIFVIKDTDITKAGEPTNDTGGAGRNTGAYACYIDVKEGTRTTGFEFRNLWLEKNNNVFFISGTIKNITVDNVRLTAYNDNEGTIFKLDSYIYGLKIANINGSGPLYKYFYDADTISVNDDNIYNKFIEEPSVTKYSHQDRTYSANSFLFARKLGDYTLQTNVAGTVTGSGANGSNTYYTIDTSIIPDPRTPFVENSSEWIDNGAVDISMYIGGVYAGEIQSANTTSITTNKSVSIGDGSVEFKVKKKLYLDGIYYQPTIGKA